VPSMTIAQLKALTEPVNGQVAIVTEAGRAGTFVFDSTGTGAENSGTTFTATDSTPGLWRRRFSGPVNVQWFGAVGDGATDDVAAFRAAAATGMDIYAPRVSAAGYVVSGVTRLQRSAYGIGMPRITLVKTITYNNNPTNDGQAQIFRWLNNTTPAEITGFHFIGDFEGTTGTLSEHAHHVAVSASSDKKVHNCVFERPYGDGVYIGKFNWGEADAAAVDVCDRISVFNNRFINPRRCATAFVSARMCSFRNNSATKANTFVGLIDLEPNLGDNTFVDGVDISDNDLYCAGRVVVFYAPTSDSVKNARVYRNTINGGSAAFDFSTASTNTLFMSNIEISENTTPNLSVSTLQYFILARNDVRGLILRGNNDFDSGRWTILRNTNCLIEGNVIDGHNTFQAGQGIELRDSTGYTIAGNVFRNLDRAIDTFGCISIIKTAVDSVTVAHIAIKNNVVRASRHFIVIRHETETDPSSLTVIDSDISGNSVDVTNNFLRAGAEVTLTNLRLDPNNVISGTLITSQRYDVNGMRTSIAAAPERAGQMALASGVLYIANGTASTANWIDVI
jgi:hypothetical protein